MFILLNRILRRAFCFLFSMVVFMNFLMGAVFAQTNAQRQAALDGQRYKPEAYQTLLTVLSRDYPGYSEDSIVAYCFWAYNELKNYFSGVTLYQVMSGIFEFSRLMQQKEMSTVLEGPRKLEKLISLYLVMKEEESAKAAVEGSGF